MRLIEDNKLRDKTHVFKDRQDAGRLIALKLKAYRHPDTFILAIPSGGVPVAYEISRVLSLPMDLLIVRKIQIPYNPEAGFGAISPDGNVIFNQGLLNRLDLTEEEINQQKTKALESIKSRNRLFRNERPYPSLRNRTVLIVDDGLASGYTMLAAIRFVKKERPKEIIVAVPTASEKTTGIILPEIDELVCLNIRSGFSFAVADAYKNWYDLNEDEVLSILKNITFS